MMPNCRGCREEYLEGLDYLEKGYNVSWVGLGERKHLLIAVFDKNGKCILW